MTPLRAVFLTLVLATAAATLGVWGGSEYVAARLRHPSLHEMLHTRLRLTASQEQRIDSLERDYGAKRQALQAEMRAANAQLAQAYQESHGYTPKVQAAIDRFHVAMDGLQKETMLHVIAMRQVMMPDQRAQFDDVVVKSLTGP